MNFNPKRWVLFKPPVNRMSVLQAYRDLSPASTGTANSLLFIIKRIGSQETQDKFEITFLF